MQPKLNLIVHYIIFQIQKRITILLGMVFLNPYVDYETRKCNSWQSLCNIPLNQFLILDLSILYSLSTLLYILQILLSKFKYLGLQIIILCIGQYCILDRLHIFNVISTNSNNLYE